MQVTHKKTHKTGDAIRLIRALEVTGVGPHPIGLTAGSAGDWLVIDEDGQHFISSGDFTTNYGDHDTAIHRGRHHIRQAGDPLYAPPGTITPSVLGAHPDAGPAVVRREPPGTEGNQTVGVGDQTIGSQLPLAGRTLSSDPLVRTDDPTGDDRRLTRGEAEATAVDRRATADRNAKNRGRDE